MKKKEEKKHEKLEDTVIVSEVLQTVIVKEQIPFVTVDFPNEGLNELARTVNKLIDIQNAL